MSKTWPEDKLRLVDVGGAGGVQRKWLPYAERILPVMFEPNPAQAAKVREILQDTFKDGIVLETGLSNVHGPQLLNITRHFGCTSLRQPNEDILSKYRIAKLFKVKEQIQVECVRYDALYQAGQVPVPDAIKIDVQGFEYEVLQGFGGLLQDCLAIELETHVYPIYRDQKLLHDLTAYLADFGFVLRRLHPKISFDGDIVELDAWFSKDITAWRQLTPDRKKKFSLLCEAWDLVDYERINADMPHNHIDPPQGGAPMQRARRNRKAAIEQDRA